MASWCSAKALEILRAPKSPTWHFKKRNSSTHNQLSTALRLTSNSSLPGDSGGVTKFVRRVSGRWCRVILTLSQSTAWSGRYRICRRSQRRLVANKGRRWCGRRPIGVRCGRAYDTPRLRLGAPRMVVRSAFCVSAWGLVIRKQGRLRRFCDPRYRLCSRRALG